MSWIGYDRMSSLSIDTSSRSGLAIKINCTVNSYLLNTMLAHPNLPSATCCYVTCFLYHWCVIGMAGSLTCYVLPCCWMGLCNDGLSAMYLGIAWKLPLQIDCWFVRNQSFSQWDPVAKIAFTDGLVAQSCSVLQIFKTLLELFRLQYLHTSLVMIMIYLTLSFGWVSPIAVLMYVFHDCSHETPQPHVHDPDGCPGSSIWCRYYGLQLWFPEYFKLLISSSVNGTNGTHHCSFLEMLNCTQLEAEFTAGNCARIYQNSLLETAATFPGTILGILTINLVGGRTQLCELWWSVRSLGWEPLYAWGWNHMLIRIQTQLWLC